MRLGVRGSIHVPIETGGVACSLELMTSLNAGGLAKFTWFGSSSILSYRICEVGVSGEWEATPKCEAETGWDPGRWVV